MMERGEGGGKRVADRYDASCRDELWQEVFRLEREYLVKHLDGCRDILSVGCGPAVIEGGLAERGFRVTGLDISREALSRAPDAVGVVAARAEKMPFQGDSFDAVIFVASLQFIGDFRKAVENSALVLRPTGRNIVM
jgi:ubiquinone/menaquinone biosynthesis C-methylase UbiE